ncbi:MAG: hypothetical protein RLZZ272_1769 [Actinomycetota bacterium]
MMRAPDTGPVHVEVPRIPRDPDGRIDVARLRALLQPADVLESAPGTGWTYLVPDLGRHGHPDRLRMVDDGRSTRVHHADGAVEDLGTDPFRAIDALAHRLGIGPGPGPASGAPAFGGGLVGAFAYDLAHRSVGLPAPVADGHDRPSLALRLVGLVVAVDPGRERAHLVLHPGLLTGDAAIARRTMLERLAWAEASAGPLAPERRVRPGPARTSLPPAQHRAAIASILEHIAAGDCYQVNLTQRLSGSWPGDVLALADALIAASPASHAALLPGLGIASISPETFLEVDGRTVRTRPIKGTRPRSTDAELDAALADDLATSAKDRAENVMIVDLERNDLGRVCRPGSVHVEELARLEAHPTVWHLASTVRGELRPDVGWGGLLAATFPSGSITGAPKRAAMRLIDRLEPVPRGWYCGALGFLAPGAARLSVAIRTATLHPDGTVEYGAGGGIVADSDPDAEVAESLDKAAAFLRVLGATHVATDTADAAGRRPRTTVPG